MRAVYEKEIGYLSLVGLNNFTLHVWTVFMLLLSWLICRTTAPEGCSEVIHAVVVFTDGQVDRDSDLLPDRAQQLLTATKLVRLAHVYYWCEGRLG